MQVTVSTPEGIDVALPVAGPGARAAAALIDLALQAVVVFVTVAAMGAVGLGAFAGIGVAILLVVAVYPIGFEVANRGRTPGKAALGLRVVTLDGGPVDLASSALRNTLRLADAFPILPVPFLPTYGVAIAVIAASPRRQRLGDLAAGTIVVRDGTGGAGGSGSLAFDYRPAPGASDMVRSWDVTAVSPAELVLVRRFLERRWSLTPDARAHLASQLDAFLRPKVIGQHGHLSSELFLEWTVVAKSSR